MKILFSQITEISTDKIYYRDNESILSIDLNECHQNWIKDRTSINSDYKSIGERDAFADPCYFKLLGKEEIYIIFDRPRTIFELLFFKKSKVNQKEFHTLYKIMQEYGWSTFDLG